MASAQAAGFKGSDDSVSSGLDFCTRILGIHTDFKANRYYDTGSRPGMSVVNDLTFTHNFLWELQEEGFVVGAVSYRTILICATTIDR